MFVNVPTPETMRLHMFCVPPEKGRGQTAALHVVVVLVVVVVVAVVVVLVIVVVIVVVVVDRNCKTQKSPPKKIKTINLDNHKNQMHWFVKLCDIFLAVRLKKKRNKTLFDEHNEPSEKKTNTIFLQIH